MDVDALDDGATPFDLSGLKDTSVRTRDQLNAAEFANNTAAVAKYLLAESDAERASFDVAWMLGLHHEMFGDVWQWAGVVRTENLNVGVPFHQVSEQLQQLAGDLQYWKTNWPDIIEQAVYLQVEAVRIHPVLNGNGRWSRLLANIWLRQNKHAITRWPESFVRESAERRSCIQAVKSAVNDRDYEPLLQMVRTLSQ